MNLKEYMKNRILYLDGGMGTVLQSRGLKPGELPEMWNLTHPDIITEIHKSYFDSGSNVVNANTFGAYSLKFRSDELEEIVKAALSNVKKAQSQSFGTQEKFAALDLGPTGRLLKPYGDLDFEDAVSIFAETVRLGVKYGADLIFIETMNDSYETKAAILAAKENSDLPVFISNAYGADGKLMTGASPAAMVAMAEGMGVDAIGANCSLGPKQLEAVADELLKYASVPVLMTPNAGLPKSVNGATVYDVSAREFADEMKAMAEKGILIVGGCCGTTPEYIKATVESTKALQSKDVSEKSFTVVSSYTHAIFFDKEPVLIGERINPTGKKAFKEALKNNNSDYILSEGVGQQERGAHILDVNVGLPEIDERKKLVESVCNLQTVTDLPLQIDTSDASAMEAAMRRYNGKAMVNSVTGKEESMRSVFPLVKKYGGVVVALTLDEGGIPRTVEGRVKIARKILSVSAEYGIKPKDIVFDTLAMTVSADSSAAEVTLSALEIIKKELGCHTSLGISNVSFGLPKRDAVNSTFFASALERGLSAAIMNPYSDEMMKTYYSYRALHGLDPNCMDYIRFMSECAETVKVEKNRLNVLEDGKDELQNAILKGFKERAAAITGEMLKTSAPLDVVSKNIIPALDEAGKRFENKTFYLPQLLMSAEAAKEAFETVKLSMKNSSCGTVRKCKFVLATVKGDIHDIGKNIVKLLLENYGFDVVDLGKDVDCERVAEEVVLTKAPLAGLSALMTTTVPAMEETIKLIRAKAPWCKIVVGGAVLNREYADSIGADKYAPDAMDTVRFAEEVFRH